MEFQHADAFADEAFSGISLIVFISDGSLTARQGLTITRQRRHFESAFVTGTDNLHRRRARVLDLSGELDFAGHPLLGAVAVLHERFGAAEPQSWLIDLPATTVPVETVLSGGMCRATWIRAGLSSGRR